MSDRKPQINFQVDPPMKVLYEEAKLHGHWVTRFCAAGLLLMVEDANLRAQALDRLREWEAAYADASEEQIRSFVRGAERAIRLRPPGTKPARRVPPAKKRTGRGGSG